MAEQKRHNIAVTVKNPNESLLVIIHEFSYYSFSDGQLQVFEGDEAHSKCIVYAAGCWQSVILDEVKQ
jgi:hypothetical protein